jgi:cell division protein FtsQ
MMKNLSTIKQNYNWTLIRGLTFFFTVIVLMVLGYQQIVTWLMDEKAVPLRHVVVTGQLQHITKQEVAQQVMSNKVGSFFNVDVNAVQRSVESLPWVYRVSVRKKWPDTLNVHVTEQAVVARWNDEKLLNVQGQIFGAQPSEGLSALPRLFGPQGSEMDALQGYRDLSSLLSINGFSVAQLTLSARFSWQLTLKNGVLLQLGRDERVARVQRFIDMFEVISEHEDKPLVSVDLRYDTGMAVRWSRPESEESKGEKNS